MKGLVPLDGTFSSRSNSNGICSLDDEPQLVDAQPVCQPVDSQFLDAVCNGVVTIGSDFKITSQNYISRMNMGDLRGKTCYAVLENRVTPCENCPRTAAATSSDMNEYTSMRCAGNARTLYEVRIFKPENGDVIEVYPSMIDREVLLKNLHLYSEELQLLNEVIENISSVMMDGETKEKSTF
ncbi:MAG TPA: hypothetical protein VK436_07120 [Methanocella sp.]|nr:hypothetical protein [Methanocella sp.]